MLIPTFSGFFFKIEMFDLHAVSIFATGTGESDITTPPFLQVVEHFSQLFCLQVR